MRKFNTNQITGKITMKSFYLICYIFILDLALRCFLLQKVNIEYRHIAWSIFSNRLTLGEKRKKERKERVKRVTRNLVIHSAASVNCCSSSLYCMSFTFCKQWSIWKMMDKSRGVVHIACLFQWFETTRVVHYCIGIQCVFCVTQLLEYKH